MKKKKNSNSTQGQIISLFFFTIWIIMLHISSYVKYRFQFLIQQQLQYLTLLECNIQNTKGNNAAVSKNIKPYKCITYYSKEKILNLITNNKL